jgi:imidazoleglycerol phosphate synthase glutamine amidotransferase subunit HisH
MPTVHLLDYVAGNVRSLVNAIEKLGWTVEWVRSPEEVANADVSTISEYSEGTESLSKKNGQNF